MGTIEKVGAGRAESGRVKRNREGGDVLNPMLLLSGEKTTKVTHLSKNKI